MPRTGAIILAAGGSSRLGSPKQLFLCHGEPLLLHVTRVVLRAAVEQVAVVVGAHAAECRAILKGLPVEIVENDRWREGMAASLCAGVNAMPHSIDGLLVVLGDQPLVAAAHLNALLAERDRPAGSGYAATVGPPAYFPRLLIPELLQLHGDHGARSILQRHREALDVIPFPGGDLDLDTPEDGARFLNPGPCSTAIYSGHVQE